MSMPARPAIDLLDQYEYVPMVDGSYMRCAHENVHAVLRAQVERYIGECSSCPSWQKPKQKGETNVDGN